MKENLILISNEKNWMEQTAKDQLAGVSRLPDVIKTAGLPDLHAGKTPVGMAVLTKERIYPHLIGNDIGCGMGLFETEVKVKKFKQTKWVSKLNHIRELSDLWIENPYNEESPIQSLGTIGGGNHFVEFQSLHSIENENLFSELNLSGDKIMMLVHSGSRGYGESILRSYLNPEGFTENSESAKTYKKAHDNALLWAERNRYLTVVKLLRYLGVSEKARTAIDCCHNYLEKTELGWIHRKGTTSALKGPVIIPGSRGTFTYICMPKKDTGISLNSLSHGAGRKWARSLCKSRIKNKYDRDSIRSTSFKSQVICHDTNLLFQEAPEAYKNIEDIIQSLIQFDLIDVVASLKPLITFKG